MSKGAIGAISILVILVIIGGIIYFANSQDDTSVTDTTTNSVTTKTPSPNSTTQTTSNSSLSTAAPESTTTEFTVRYTSSGYSPDTIEVPVGSTVKFINESASLMWTASDPHPTHTNFSVFDAKKGYKQGETYSFTFDKAGTYRYHNHSVPGDGGTVIVK